MAYNKAYRKYEQATREYEKAHRQPSEELGLIQERLAQVEKDSCMILKPLRRLGLIVGNNRTQSGSLDGDKLLDVGGVIPVELNTGMKWLKRIKNLLDFLIHKKRTMPNSIS